MAIKEKLLVQEIFVDKNSNIIEINIFNFNSFRIRKDIHWGIK